MRISLTPEQYIRASRARETELTQDQRDRVALELERLFPWLGTDDDAGSGADVISQLALYHAMLLEGDDQ